MMPSFFVLRLLLLAFLPLVLATGCEEESDIDPRPILVGGYVNVQVVHPDLGPGKEFVVRLYLTPEDKDANLAYKVLETNAEGWVRFQDIPLGARIVDCSVPGSPVLYARKDLEVEGGEPGVQTVLMLMPQ